MPLSEVQKNDALDVLNTLYSHTIGRRVLSTIFRTLPDRDEWLEYYEVIPQPRSLDGVKSTVERNRNTTVEGVRADIELVFKNAMHFNQDGSLIWTDAETLLDLFHTTWASKASLQPSASSSTTINVSSTPSNTVSTSGKTKLIIKREPKPAPRSSPPDDGPKMNRAFVELPAPSSSSSRKKGASSTPVPVVDMDVDAPSVEKDDRMDVDSSNPHAHEDLSPTPSTLTVEEVRAMSEYDLVKHCEGRMKIWGGPFTHPASSGDGTSGGSGWMAQPKIEPHARYSEVVGLIRNFRSAVTGDRPAAALEKLADRTDIPFLYHKDGLSLSTIDKKALQMHYPNAQTFDVEMARLFEKARRTYRGPRASSEPASGTAMQVDGTEEPKKKVGALEDVVRERGDYGRILILQRMWQHLTSPASLTVSTMSRAPYGFASLEFGPGSTPAYSLSSSQPPGGSMGELAQDLPLEVIKYKGQTYRVGDFVHLANPSAYLDDASRPIVGQIRRMWVQKEAAEDVEKSAGSGQVLFSVRWFYLPEQTFHDPKRVFLANEVFATNLTHTHHVEDVLEHVFVQFHTCYTQGRPLGPRWFPGWPLYVCRDEYRIGSRAMGTKAAATPNNDTHAYTSGAGRFVRIKDEQGWLASVPAEALPRPAPTPTLPKEEPPVVVTKSRKGKSREKAPVPPPTPPAPQKPADEFLPTVPFDPTLVANNGEPITIAPRKLRSPFVRSPNLRAPGGLLPVSPPVTTQQNQTSVKAGPDDEAGESEEQEDDRPIKIIGPRMTRRKAATGAAAVADPSNAGGVVGPSSAIGGVPGVASGSAAGRKRKIGADERSVHGASGGPAYVREAKVEGLPAETVEKFDRDPKSGKLLWFSGPPMINPALPPSLSAPRHSLAYLAFLANGGREAADEDTKVDDNDDDDRAKRIKGSSNPADGLMEGFSIQPDGSVVFAS
ncbi:hypothetical protein DL93DRAFT_2231442 [Clavulina sp. PMI_390]|nr:hypothetical protein DL93DRAFT_2231442 [Clavulina sp. PMI_390]